MDGAGPADAHVPVTTERIRHRSSLQHGKSEPNAVSVGRIVKLHANKTGRDKNARQGRMTEPRRFHLNTNENRSFISLSLEGHRESTVSNRRVHEVRSD